MNVTGFREVFQHALHLQINAGLIMRVPDLDALLLLKFFSWNDQPVERTRDADDMIFIFESYWNIATVQDQIYDGAHQDLLEFEPFLTELVSTRVIARNLQQQFSKETIDQMLDIIINPTKRSMLIPQMQKRAQKPTMTEQILDAFIAEFSQPIPTRLRRCEESR